MNTLEQRVRELEAVVELLLLSVEQLTEVCEKLADRVLGDK